MSANHTPLLRRARDGSLICLAALAALVEGPAQIVAAVTVALCLSQVRWSDARFGWVEVGLLTWLLAGLPGLIAGGEAVSSGDALRPLSCLLYFVGRATPVASRTVVARMGWAFCVAMVLNGAYGLLQVFVVNPPLEQLVLTRIASERLVNPEDPSRLIMATGLFYNRVKLAHVGVVGMGALVAMMVARGPRLDRLRPWLVAGLLILGAAVYLSYRRAAPVALFVALVTWALVARSKRVLGASALMSAAFGASFLAMPAGRARIALAAASFEERLLIYRSAFDMSADHPLFGVGHGMYPQVIREYAISDAPAFLLNLASQAHNILVHTLAETGIVGLAGFLLAVGAALLAAARRIRGGAGLKAAPEARLDEFAFLAVVTLLVIGALHFVLYHNPVALLFWYGLGVCAGPWPTKDTPSLAAPSPSDPGALRIDK